MKSFLISAALALLLAFGIAGKFAYDAQQANEQATYWQVRTNAAMNDLLAERDARRVERSQLNAQISQAQATTPEGAQRSAPACAKTFMAFLQVPTTPSAQAAFPCMSTLAQGGMTAEVWATQAVQHVQPIGKSVGYLAGVQFDNGSWVTAWVDTQMSVGYLVYLDTEGKVYRLE